MNPGPIKGLGAMMRLKAWFTLEDAAKYLSVVFDTDVSTADVLRFALDRHLTLSVRFVNGAYGRRYRPATPVETQRFHEHFEARSAEVAAARAAGLPIPPGTPLVEPVEVKRERDEAAKILHLSDEVFDLPLEGGERLDVEHEYQRLTRGPSVELICLDATLIDAADGRRLEVMARFDPSDCALQPEHNHPANYFPPGTLGDDVVFVVRTSALRALEAALAGESEPCVDSKPMTTRERSTLLTLIAALAHHSHIDISKPAQAAERLEGLSVDLGARVAARTILEHLKRVPDALERKAQD